MSTNRKSFWDLRSPWLQPLWRRRLIVAACAGWTVVEILLGSVFWTMIFGAAAIFLFVKLLVKFDQEPDP